jgi:hypothetical protein
MKKSVGLLGMMAAVMGMSALGSTTMIAPELRSQQPILGRSGFPTPKSHGSVKKYQREMTKIKSRKKSKR